MKFNRFRLSFYSYLFSIDWTYIFLKCISQILSIASEYYAVIVLYFSINDLSSNSSNASLLTKKLVILTLLFFLIRIVLHVINASISVKKIRILEYDRNRKNSLFSKMPLYLYEEKEVQKLLTNLKYLEMNGSTAIGKLMDAPLLFFSLFVSAFLELMCIAPIFRGITNTELIISFFFLVIYVGMILLSSKLKAKYMKKGVKSFSNEGKKKLSMVASYIDYQYDANINTDIRYYTQRLLDKGAIEECKISKEVFSTYWNNVSKGSFFSTFFRTISFISALVLIAYFATIGRISLGSIVLYSYLLEKITSHIEKAMIQLNVMIAGDEYFEKRYKLNKMALSETSSRDKLKNKEWKTIEFKNISYSYPGSEKKILDSLNLIINRNDSTALVGLNGSGKSTLVQLLLKFRKPDEGVILIDGRDIWSINTDDYMDLFSPLFQSSSLFSFSLRDNLFVTKETHEQEIKREMRSLNLDDVDLDEIIGENNVGFSGGQEKRILLLRSWLNHNKYMILDEPTSASDPEGESFFFKKLEERDGYLIVTHKISKLKKVSRIVVIEEGKVVSDGTWDELSSDEGLFKKLLECERRLYDTR